MTRISSLPRPLLPLLAVVFAVATLLYSIIWIYYIRWEHPKAQLGVESTYIESEGVLRIDRVVEGSGAERAGLQPGDRVLSINGRLLETPKPLYDGVARGRPGDQVRLQVERPGKAAGIELEAVLGPWPESAPTAPLTQRVAIEVVRCFPVLFLVVGLPVLFMRYDDRNAWLLSLLFAGFIAGAPLLQLEPVIHPTLRGFALAYKVIFNGLSPALFYWFFAVFPLASPLERRLPWLKWLLLVAAAAVAVPVGAWVFAVGGAHPLQWLENQAREHPILWVVLGTYGFGVFALGLVSLVSNGLGAPTAEARRKIRVIVWGTVCGLTPLLLLSGAAIYARRDIYQFPFWVWVPTILALFLLPLSFAYAVVKHRVLEIPVLLKRSARYLLVQRGFTILLFVLSIALTLLFTLSFTRYIQAQMELGLPTGITVGVLFGGLLVWAGTHLEKRVTQRLDRAFFRSAYDARLILQDLAEKTRTAMNREELSELLEHHIRQALFPEFLTIYLEIRPGSLRAVRGWAPPGLEVVPTAHPVLEEIAHRGQPWEVPPLEAGGAGKLLLLGPLAADCMVPILGRDARLAGLVLLGPRLAEEPYSGEDKRLLASVASQAGVALENLRLAEEIAERMEAERRAALEMDIAKQVQGRLLPQKAPRLETLEYAGACVQARAVGGDYYDFLDLGPGRVGLVLADISGKGISGALLMANLQANLRSQYAVALENLPRLLESVNRQLFESTPPSHFATLFFGSYDDANHRLHYVNCGQNPPILLRADGREERLAATATVLGLFEEWQCSSAEVQLSPGDTLVVFTDGITEARSDQGEEFGDARLLETLRRHHLLSVSSLLTTIVDAVEAFSGREQEDDLTLVIARSRW